MDNYLGNVGDILYHNSFAYCCNSPVSYIDSDGQVRLYGLEVCCYAFFHSIVQNDLCALNKAKKETHPLDDSLLRIDVRKGNEIYEIKPDKAYWIAIGERQLDNYVKASGYTLKKGNACDLILPVYKPLKVGDVTIQVTVRAEGALVLYKVTVSKGLNSTAGVPVLEKDDKPVLANPAISVSSFLFGLGAILTGIGVSVGVGGMGQGGVSGGGLFEKVLSID